MKKIEEKYNTFISNVESMFEIVRLELKSGSIGYNTLYKLEKTFEKYVIKNKAVYFNNKLTDAMIEKMAVDYYKGKEMYATYDALIHSYIVGFKASLNKK